MGRIGCPESANGNLEDQSTQTDDETEDLTVPRAPRRPTDLKNGTKTCVEIFKNTNIIHANRYYYIGISRYIYYIGINITHANRYYMYILYRYI